MSYTDLLPKKKKCKINLAKDSSVLELSMISREIKRR